MRNIALKLCYDGSNYHGWQIQKNDETVAGTLLRAIKSVCNGEKLTGCGRTDAGVHAKIYCANFQTQSRIPIERLPFALNSILPPDIAVLDAVEASEDFNAILSCKSKEYTYEIYNSRLPNPFYHNRAYFYPVVLDADKMNEAAQDFVGRHDFAAVRSLGTDVKSTVRNVFYFEVKRNCDTIYFKVCADGFLYNMVRAMVGTLIYVSLGKIDSVSKVLESGNRILAGPTVPPQGLYMTKLCYDGVVGEMMNR